MSLNKQSIHPTHIHPQLRPLTQSSFHFSSSAISNITTQIYLQAPLSSPHRNEESRNLYMKDLSSNRVTNAYTCT